MKLIYTILFFADTFLLTKLFFAFIRLLDKGINWVNFVLLFIAILSSTFFLIYCLINYLQLPPHKRKQ